MFTTHYEKVTSWQRLYELEDQFFIYVDLAEHPTLQSLGIGGQVTVKVKPGEGYQLERSIKDYIPTIKDIHTKLFGGKDLPVTAWIAGYEWWLRVEDKENQELWLIRVRPADRTFMYVKGNAVMLIYAPKSEFELQTLREMVGKFSAKHDKFIEEFKRKKEIVESNLLRTSGSTAKPATTTVVQGQKPAIQIDISEIFDDITAPTTTNETTPKTNQNETTDLDLL